MNEALIAFLRGRRDELEDKLIDVRNGLAEVKQQLAEALSPYKVGDVIEYERAWGKKRLLRARIDRISPGYHECALYVTLARKDGTFGVLTDKLDMGYMADKVRLVNGS